MSNGETIDVIVRGENAETVESLFGVIGAGTDQIESSGFSGAEVIVTGVITGGFSTFLAGIVRDWRSGVIVDARSERIKVEKSRDLPRGDVLIVAKDGDRTELHEPKDSLIASVIGQIFPKIN